VAEKVCGVIGATSFIGASLLPRLVDSEYTIAAFTRDVSKISNPSIRGSIIWNPEDKEIPQWISLAPIWCLQDLIPMIEKRAPRKVIVLSTTSLYTKVTSKQKSEMELVKKIEKAEKEFMGWAEANNVEWVVLRPTLIYGFGRDKNISEIAKIIRIFGFFPLLGKGDGLRQPIHVDDVAYACEMSLKNNRIKNRSYNISGAEIITYKEMVSRVFLAMNIRRRIVSLPRWTFKLVLVFLRRISRFRNWSLAMVDRMNQDMVFEHSDAKRDLGFEPRAFKLEKQDIPG